MKSVFYGIVLAQRNPTPPPRNMGALSFREALRIVTTSVLLIAPPRIARAEADRATLQSGLVVDLQHEG